jgi:hypothetical protein
MSEAAPMIGWIGAKRVIAPLVPNKHRQPTTSAISAVLR